MRREGVVAREVTASNGQWWGGIVLLGSREKTSALGIPTALRACMPSCPPPQKLSPSVIHALYSYTVSFLSWPGRVDLSVYVDPWVSTCTAAQRADSYYALLFSYINIYKVVAYLCPVCYVSSETTTRVRIRRRVVVLYNTNCGRAVWCAGTAIRCRACTLRARRTIMCASNIWDWMGAAAFCPHGLERMYAASTCWCCWLSGCTTKCTCASGGAESAVPPRLFYRWGKM